MKIPEDIRKDIPITSKYIYFDSGATCLTPLPVVKAMDEYYLEYRANVHRGVHRLSQKASEKFDEAREKIAHFLNASFEEIIFVKNTTEALNYVAMGLQWEKGDTVVVSELEHHSNFLPFFRLQNHGVNLKVIRCTKMGTLIESELSEKISGAKLISVSHISNISGAVTPVKKISKIAKETGALFCIDAAQSVGHRPVDVENLKCDFLAFPGHKGIMGPTGIGVLYVRKSVMDEFDLPFIGGGTIEDVSLTGYTLAEPPEKYEAGTPHIAGAIGLGAAADYITRIGCSHIEKYEKMLIDKTITDFDRLPTVKWYGPKTPHSGVVSFNMKNCGAHNVAQMLDTMGNIMVRSGHHCALPALKKMGITKAVRASYHCYNTLEEIDAMVDILTHIEKI
ncbi:MAG: cysteine desulfurase [Candidatus Methanofastidiosia archaeon]|jgi:cysteine desulfurase/selenocysteine lyase